jgi:hypothetical protein
VAPIGSRAPVGSTAGAGTGSGPSARVPFWSSAWSEPFFSTTGPTAGTATDTAAAAEGTEYNLWASDRPSSPLTGLLPQPLSPSLQPSDPFAIFDGDFGEEVKDEGHFHDAIRAHDKDKADPDDGGPAGDARFGLSEEYLFGVHLSAETEGGTPTTAFLPRTPPPPMAVMPSPAARAAPLDPFGFLDPFGTNHTHTHTHHHGAAGGTLRVSASALMAPEPAARPPPPARPFRVLADFPAGPPAPPASPFPAGATWAPGRAAPGPPRPHSPTGMPIEDFFHMEVRAHLEQGEHPLPPSLFPIPQPICPPT